MALNLDNSEPKSLSHIMGRLSRGRRSVCVRLLQPWLASHTACFNTVVLHDYNITCCDIIVTLCCYITILLPTALSLILLQTVEGWILNQSLLVIASLHT